MRQVGVEVRVGLGHILVWQVRVDESNLGNPLLVYNIGYIVRLG